MLTPEYLDGLPESILSLYAEAEEEILCDMARRISAYDYWIPAADWQYQKMLETGRTREEILRVLSSKTGRSQEELRQLMQQAANDSLRADEAIYRAAGATGPSIMESAALKNILNAGFKLTQQTFRNLTRTTAQIAGGQFEHALDKAWLKVQSGAFSVDAAVQSAIKELCAQGVGSIQYPSGRTDTLETAVRRAVVTGVNQTCGQLQLERAKEIGCDLMELSAHAGARPEHAEWQGQIVSLSGARGYLTLRDIGYGDVTGFKGVNCRHDWNPYFEGMPRTWTDKKLRELNEPKYEYNGKKLTEYEAQQVQRYNERQIRRWKNENLAMSAAGQDITESAVKLRSWEERQKDFLDQTGLKRQQSREQVAGFGRSEAARAASAAKEAGIIDKLRENGVKYIQRISSKEIVVDAGQPRIVGMSGHASDNLQNKSDRAAMTMERAQSFVDNNKLTLYDPNRETLKFLAQEGYAILSFKHNLVTAVPQRWRKKYDAYL